MEKLLLGVIVLSLILFGCTSITNPLSNSTVTTATNSSKVNCPDFMQTTYIGYYTTFNYASGVSDFRFKDNWTIGGETSLVFCGPASSPGQNINYLYCNSELGNITLNQINISSNGTILSTESLDMSFAIENTSFTDVNATQYPGIAPPVLDQIVETDCFTH